MLSNVFVNLARLTPAQNAPNPTLQRRGCHIDRFVVAAVLCATHMALDYLCRLVEAIAMLGIGVLPS